MPASATECGKRRGNTGHGQIWGIWTVYSYFFSLYQRVEIGAQKIKKANTNAPMPKPPWKPSPQNRHYQANPKSNKPAHEHGHSAAKRLNRLHPPATGISLLRAGLELASSLDRGSVEQDGINRGVIGVLEKMHREVEADGRVVIRRLVVVVLSGFGRRD